jgi:hypothetical protein
MNHIIKVQLQTMGTSDQRFETCQDGKLQNPVANLITVSKGITYPIYNGYHVRWVYAATQLEIINSKELRGSQGFNETYVIK